MKKGKKKTFQIKIALFLFSMLNTFSPCIFLIRKYNYSCFVTFTKYTVSPPNNVSHSTPGKLSAPSAETIFYVFSQIPQ